MNVTLVGVVKPVRLKIPVAVMEVGLRLDAVLDVDVILVGVVRAVIQILVHHVATTERGGVMMVFLIVVVTMVGVVQHVI